MYTGIDAISPFGKPGTIDPAGSLRETNPLPPPGNPVDLTADLHPSSTGHYPAQFHQVSVVLAETITEGEDWVFVFTPTRMVNGLPIADDLGAVTRTITVGATATPDGFGAVVVADYTSATTVTTLGGVSDLTRLGEFVGSVTYTAATDTLLYTAKNAGEVFTVSVTPEAGGGATVATITDATGVDMPIGIAVARTGELADDGVTPIIRKLQSGDTADDVWGIVAASGTRIKAIDPITGYTARYYGTGRDIPIQRIDGGGQWTVYSEGAVDYDDRVWVRVIATGSEIAGAFNDTPDEVVQTLTITPTEANATVYQGFIQAKDRAGLVVANIPFNYTSDADGTAAEIVTGIRADIDTPIATYATPSGTVTVILTAVAGYTLELISTGAGVLAAVPTGGTNDHVLLPATKRFSQTTRAGIAAVQL